MTEEVRFRNPVQAMGFAQVWHAIRRDKKLGDGAFRLLTAYMEYAQGKGTCWPSLARLADELERTTRTIIRWNQELEKLGYIERVQRSNGTTITYLADFTQMQRLRKLAETSGADAPVTPVSVVTPVSPEEETLSDSIQHSVSFPSEKKQSAAPTAEVEYVDLEAEDLHEEKLRLARLAGDGVPAPDLGKRPRVKAHPKRKVTEHTRMVRALQQAFKFPGKMTQSQRGRLNKLAPLILMNGYTLEQVRDVGSIWWTTWPGNEGSPPSNDQFLQRLEQDSQRRAKTRVFTS